MKKSKLRTLLLTLLCIVTLGSFNGFAQNDSIQETEKVKKNKKVKDEFKVLAGATINNISNSAAYEASSELGYIIGAKYKRGKFFYWELGARYNAATYSLIAKSYGGSPLEGNLNVKSLDVPMNVGINLLSITSRIVGLRAYVGALPTFVLNVSDNNLNIEKDDLNTFLMQAQAGIGLDIAFFFLETGVNYGFTDVLGNASSNPTQAFINLGFRF